MRFIEDDKLPTDVVSKEYSESRHALCCLNCGFESEFRTLSAGLHWQTAVCSDGARLPQPGNRRLMSWSSGVPLFGWWI
jgi:hypothetical protein